MASARRALTSGLKIPFTKRSPIENLNMELSIPSHFRCPISLELMRDPVTASTGITYDRQNIETWLERGNQTCPVTNQALKSEDLIPNHSLRRMIQDWCVANRSSGIERIPTPRIPATPTQVSELLSEIASSSRQGDRRRCCELVAEIKALGRESERNRRCIASCGSGRILSNSFRELAMGSAVNCATGVMEEILSALVGLFPLDSEAHGHMGAPESLESIVSILKTGDLAGKLNAVLVLKELVASLDAEQINVVVETDGLVEALVKLVEKPVSPPTTKASLVTTFYLVSSNERNAARFVEMGLVSVLLEILVDWEKSMYEKALGVLDGVLEYKRGREMAYSHALTVPVLVKKIFRVSDMATAFAVSALWKLCKNYKKEGGEIAGEEGVLVEALEVGAFQKLLLLLQVCCSGTTKEKASELLKLLNGSREMVECIETADFKGLKRPF